jgi:hypothetical protein
MLDNIYNEFSHVENSFRSRYEKKRKEYDDDTTKNDYIDSLQTHRENFDVLLSDITELHTAYFNDWKNDKDKREEADKFMKTSEVYLYNIQNRYLAKIDFKLNLLQVKQNLDEAERSIYWGKFSVGVGVISIALAIVIAAIAFCQTKQSNKEYIEQQDLFHKEYILNLDTLKHQNNQQLIADSMINNNVDCMHDVIPE